MAYVCTRQSCARLNGEVGGGCGHEPALTVVRHATDRFWGTPSRIEVAYPHRGDKTWANAGKNVRSVRPIR